jgi:hypothetical protein
MPRKISTPESDDDILWGAEEIGAAIGRAAAQVYYLHSIGAISTKKVGHKLLIAERGELRRSLLADEAVDRPRITRS